MTVVIKGSNVLLNRPLFQADGVTPIVISSLSYCSCRLMQKRAVVQTFVLGTNDELRAGDDGVSLVLELTSTVTAALVAGALTERYKVEFEDLDYEAEPDESIKEVDLNEILIAA